LKFTSVSTYFLSVDKFLPFIGSSLFIFIILSREGASNRSFQVFDFLRFLCCFTCSKPPIRDNHRKVLYPKTQQYNETEIWNKEKGLWSSFNRLFSPLSSDHATKFWDLVHLPEWTFDRKRI